VLRLVDNPTSLELPLFTATVPVGFPSPAYDQIEAKLDLIEHLVRHPAATFFIRASGDQCKVCKMKMHKAPSKS
jgi:DNA polymerase V